MSFEKNALASEKKFEDRLKEYSSLYLVANCFSCRLNCAFKDKYKYYMVLDPMLGGYLGHRLAKFKYFNEVWVKFYVACILIGIYQIHSRKLIFGDLC